MQLVIRARGARARLDALTELAGHGLTDEDAEPLMLALAELAATFTDDDAHAAGAWQLRYADRLTRRWTDARIDAAITPTTGVTPRPLEDMRPTDDVRQTYQTYRQVGCFAGCFNMTGHAAISLPWWTTRSLPVGVQLITGPGDEQLLLRLASQLTRTCPRETTVRIAEP